MSTPRRRSNAARPILRQVIISTRSNRSTLANNPPGTSRNPQKPPRNLNESQRWVDSSSGGCIDSFRRNAGESSQIFRRSNASKNARKYPKISRGKAERIAEDYRVGCCSYRSVVKESFRRDSGVVSCLISWFMNSSKLHARRLSASASCNYSAFQLFGW